MPRKGLRTYPAHIVPKGRGARYCAASGFLREAAGATEDVRQGVPDKDFADTTPGFGTHHPQDVKQIPPKEDPKAIRNARNDNNPGFTTAAELGFTDAEVREFTRNGLPLPRSR